jgi:hypothetical protein
MPPMPAELFRRLKGVDCPVGLGGIHQWSYGLRVRDCLLCRRRET